MEGGARSDPRRDQARHRRLSDGTSLERSRRVLLCGDVHRGTPSHREGRRRQGSQWTSVSRLPTCPRPPGCWRARLSGRRWASCKARSTHCRIRRRSSCATSSFCCASVTILALINSCSHLARGWRVRMVRCWAALRSLRVAAVPLRRAYRRHGHASDPARGLD